MGISYDVICFNSHIMGMYWGTGIYPPMSWNMGCWKFLHLWMIFQKYQPFLEDVQLPRLIMYALEWNVSVKLVPPLRMIKPRCPISEQILCGKNCTFKMGKHYDHWKYHPWRRCKNGRLDMFKVAKANMTYHFVDRSVPHDWARH